VLENIAKEPEIDDVAEVLLKMGAHVVTDEKGRLIIEGKEKKLIKEKFQEDRQLANERSREIIKEFHRR